MMVYTVKTVYQDVKLVIVKQHAFYVLQDIYPLLIKLNVFLIVVLDFIIQVHLVKNALLDVQAVDH